MTLFLSAARVRPQAEVAGHTNNGNQRQQDDSDKHHVTNPANTRIFVPLNQGCFHSLSGRELGSC